MKLEHYSIERLKEEIRTIVGKHLDLKTHRIFFFGSRVNGKSTERSDIDIGVEGPESISLDIMAKIRDEVDNLPTLYTIEFVDMRSVSGRFREVALTTTERIT